ncbi:MAG: toll/interleukin-1 receptor domain-containing protein [Lachnospiraceae bacterium]|nr:toll/interleukin-1 receptor domain-containing protein [Lachnospiraceae bacterium]
MAILKCKMCGGTIEYVPGTTVGECQHCGTKQTLPKTGDEVVSNLFNRANNMRLKCEFDKAMSIYEKIVEQDDSEAEAHWGIVLCRYGIEYVEDPTTKKRIPTCHRTLYDAVTKDPDYQAALDYSDTLQQTIYEKEAKEIDKIQKEILAIVQNEEPFDVFICYKETDEDGNRTKDSVIANDIYHQLTLEGYKVFYAAITLEDKLGQEYEPYIFAALNTAKVMLVIGSRSEFFNAVWVKNEWSRFLNLMKTDRSKILIPCYKDMDAYELPEEFSHLQAQDMSKLGFMLDLNRVIRKIIDTKEQKIEVKEVHVVSNDNNVAPNVAPLLKRVFMFLEDNNWAEADTYCEKVLDIDPENAEAYVGKLMAELHVGIKENLSKCKQPFDANINYKKAVRFGSSEVANTLDGYINQINERIKKEQLTETYNRGIKTMNNANDENKYKSAAKIFESIIGFQESDSLYKQCIEKAEVCRKEAIYSSAKKKMETSHEISSYESAIELFSSILDWKDAKEQINTCRNCIEKIKADQEIARQEKQRKLEEEEIAREKAEKRFKKISAFTIIVVVIVLVFVIIWENVLYPNIKYNDAVDLYDSGNYEDAIEAFKALDGYKDSRSQVLKCEDAICDEKYNTAIRLCNSGNYEDAISVVEELKDYKNNSERIIKIQNEIYDNAIKLYNSGDYENAISAFKALNGYRESSEMIIKCNKAFYDKK